MQWWICFLKWREETAFQFREEKTPNLTLCYIYIDEELLQKFQDIAEFEKLSRSKILNIKLKNKGEGYEKLIKKIHKKNIHRHKNTKKNKKKMPVRKEVSEQLPYFRDQGTNTNVSRQ